MIFNQSKEIPRRDCHAGSHERKNVITYLSLMCRLCHLQSRIFRYFPCREASRRLLQKYKKIIKLKTIAYTVNTSVIVCTGA